MSIESSLIHLAIQWQGALILASPFLLGVMFWVWKESDKIRNRWIRHQKEVRYLEDLIIEANDALIGDSVALGNEEMRELGNKMVLHREEHGDLDHFSSEHFTQSEIFRAKKLLLNKETRQRLRHIIRRREHYWQGE